MAEDLRLPTGREIIRLFGMVACIGFLAGIAAALTITWLGLF